MATQFTLDQLGIIFRVKLTDCISSTPVTTANISSQSIEFTRPDGSKFSKPATLLADVANPGEFFLQYRNIPPESSILNQIRDWTYQGAGILTDGSNFKTSERKIFWVVP